MAHCFCRNVLLYLWGYNLSHKLTDMKTNNRDCIKLLSFLFCAVLALGCNKNDVGETKEEFVDDSPVAIRLSAGDPSYVMTTKAAVEEWSNSVLNVFGMKRGRGAAVGDGVYDFNDKVTIRI